MGSLTIRWPDRELDDFEETCALDVADAGGATLDRVGDLLNITRERVRQLEEAALKKVRLPLLRANGGAR